MAAVQHYSFLVDSLLDTEDQLSDGTSLCLLCGPCSLPQSADNLLSRNSVAHVVAETCKLKQLSVLHEVSLQQLECQTTLFLLSLSLSLSLSLQISVENLVRLIGIMDRHVLDSAELLMNTTPVSDSECGLLPPVSVSV